MQSGSKTKLWQTAGHMSAKNIRDFYHFEMVEDALLVFFEVMCYTVCAGLLLPLF